MNFFAWAISKCKRLDWIDIQMIKLSVFCFALLLAKLWSPLLSQDWYWYALVTVLAAIKPLTKVFGE